MHSNQYVSTAGKENFKENLWIPFNFYTLEKYKANEILITPF